MFQEFWKEYGGVDDPLAGTCLAGTGYVWGFSFLMTFLVAILNLIFVLLIYGLWYFVCRPASPINTTSQFSDAVTLVTKAQQQYGDDVREWEPKKLEKEILKGRHGIKISDAVSIDDEKAADDDWRSVAPNAGDRLCRKINAGTTVVRDQ